MDALSALMMDGQQCEGVESDEDPWTDDEDEGTAKFNDEAFAPTPTDLQMSLDHAPIRPFAQGVTDGFVEVVREQVCDASPTNGTADPKQHTADGVPNE